MRERPVQRVQYTVPCGCGAKIALDARDFEHARLCRSCGGTYTVTWDWDPKTGKKMPMVVMKTPRATGAKPQPSAPLVPLRFQPSIGHRAKPGTKALDRAHVIEEEPAAPGRPARPSRALKPGECLCPCGQVLPARTSRTGMDFTCAACGRKGEVEQVRNAKTQEVALRAVVKEERAAAPPKPAPAPEQPSGGIPADAQAAPCECGAELLVCPADVGRPIQCPTCSRPLSVQKGDDGATLRVRPLLRPTTLRPRR